VATLRRCLRPERSLVVLLALRDTAVCGTRDRAKSTVGVRFQRQPEGYALLLIRAGPVVFAGRLKSGTLVVIPTLLALVLLGAVLQSQRQM
jgi:hypothetical protein